MDYSKPITSKAEAEAFIRDLHSAGKLFHFDASPETIISATPEGDLVRAFSDAEAAQLSARVGELFTYLDDPFALALALVNPSDDPADRPTSTDDAREIAHRAYGVTDQRLPCYLSEDGSAAMLGPMLITLLD